jgi:hypothetical protein
MLIATIGPKNSTAGSPTVTVDDVELEGEGNPANSNDADNDENSSKPPPAEGTAPNLPPPAAAPPPPAPELPELPPGPPAPPADLPDLPAGRLTRNREPSRYLRNILEEKGATDDRASMPDLPVGIRVPAAVPEADDVEETEGELAK